MRCLLTILCFVFIFCPRSIRAQQDATSIEVFVDRATHPTPGPRVTVPFGVAELRFRVRPQSFRTRYRLEGLDADWKERTDPVAFMVQFLNGNGDRILQRTYATTGISEGWNNSVEESTFTERRESITVPDGAEYLSIIISTAGPPSAVGFFAVSGITITSEGGGENPGTTFLRDCRVPGSTAPLWIKSGTHPSMAHAVNLEDDEASPILILRDDDATAHADWATGIYALPKVSPGEILDVRWKEVHNIGAGGDFAVSYERLPPGGYRLVAEELTLSGDPVGRITSVPVVVPLPYWKNVWFWLGCSLAVAALAILYGHHLIRRKINRHLRHAQLITDERLRIARDLHDDLGTRLSHISLLGSYAESKVSDEEARASLRQITNMSGELISTLSETVWMLNPKNNQLEALVDFLCRLVSELCRLSEIRCRIDAMSVMHNPTLSHEVRHNVSLSVKEVVNNALKHACATEIRMRIWLEGHILRIAVADDGVGISGDAKRGNGLENIEQRMAFIRGKCLIAEIPEGGVRVSLDVPLG